MAGKIQQTVQQYRQQLLAHEHDAAQSLEHAYQHTLSMIQPRLDALYKEIQAFHDKDEPVPPEFLYEQHRLKSLQQFISGQISHYGTLAQLTTQHLQQAGVQLGQKSAMDMLSSTVPSGINYSFGVPSPKAIADLVGATQKGSPLADLFAGFGPEAAKNVSDALITGLSLGDNPRVVADSVMQALQVPRYRALTIARTEMLRSYRSANMETYRANSDVVGKWRWTCDKSARTCAACLGMDGQLFDLDEDMDSHPNCRCAPIPITRDWSDILGQVGIDASDIEDTRPDIQLGSDWLAEQDEDTQRSILGNKYDGYTNGDFDLSDIVGRSSDPDWGGSIYVKSLADAQKQEGIDGETDIDAALAKLPPLSPPNDTSTANDAQYAQAPDPADSGLPHPDQDYINAYDKLQADYAMGAERYDRFGELLPGYSIAQEEHGMTLEEYNSALQKHVEKIVGEADTFIRIKPSNLEKVLADGRFKSQFETRGSGGAFNRKDRANREQQLYGYSPTMPPAQRPIYGYLSANPNGNSPDNMLRTYGSTAVLLKPGVRDRATFTFGDSNGATVDRVPSALNDPSRRAIPIGTDGLTMKSVDMESEYTEVQYHGGLFVDDIAEVIFHRGGVFTNSKPSADLLAQLDALHIPWREVKY